MSRVEVSTLYGYEVGRATAFSEAIEAVEKAVASVEHPCHDVCVGGLHADCQCAAYVRQEARAAVLQALHTLSAPLTGTGE